MNFVEIIAYGMFAFIVLMLGILALMYRKSIHRFFKPEQYHSIEMITLDGNIDYWYERKNIDLDFEYNGGYYNIGDTNFLNGKIKHSYYQEGNKDPINPKTRETITNAQLDREKSKVRVSRALLDDKTDIDDFLVKFGLPIGLGIGLIIGGIFF